MAWALFFPNSWSAAPFAILHGLSARCPARGSPWFHTKGSPRGELLGSPVDDQHAMVIIWLLYGYCMVIIWLLHGYYMANNNLVGGFSPPSPT